MNLSYLLLGLFSFMCVPSAALSFAEALDMTAGNLIREFPAQNDITCLWASYIKVELGRDNDHQKQLTEYVLNPKDAELWDPDHLRKMYDCTRALCKFHPDLPVLAACRLPEFVRAYVKVIDDNFGRICEKVPGNQEYMLYMSKVEDCLCDIKNKINMRRWWIGEN